MNTVAFLNAGRADSFVLRLDSPDGRKTAVIDGGTKFYQDRRVLADYLEREGIKQIDLLILTHLHQDHFGGFYHLIDKVKISRAVIPYGDVVFHPRVGDYIKSHEFFREYHEFYQYLVRSGTSILRAKECAGREFTFGESRLSCLYPLADTILKQEPYIDRLCSPYLTPEETDFCCQQFRALCNEQSSIWLLHKAGRDEVLFSADCTAETMDLAIREHPAKPKIVKLSHHGINRRYFSAEQLEKLAPQEIVISNAEELCETVQEDALPIMPQGAEIRYTFHGDYTVTF